MVLGLASMKQLMAHFNHPENQLPTIHIAGTNGKGSTAKMVATILQAAGYKVGLFTSPSLVDFNERIQINGQQITDTQLMAQVDRMTAALGPDEYYTEFEVFTGLAWLTFEANQVDFVVLEVAWVVDWMLLISSTNHWSGNHKNCPGPQKISATH